MSNPHSRTADDAGSSGGRDAEPVREHSVAAAPPQEPLAGDAGLDAHLVVDRSAFRLDVTLTAVPGEVVALLGPNGAGKTTALRALAGLVPLTDGHLRLDGTALERTPPENRPVGVVFQDYLLFPHLSALDNVAFGPRCRGVGKAEARAQAAAWLDRMGLADHAGAKPRRLSGGQAQRVAVARALATRPRLLILDEPTSALSAAEAERLFALVERMRDDGIAVLYVSHRLGEIDALADRLVVLRDGRLTEDQTKPFDWDAALRAMLAQAQEATTARPVREGAEGEVVLSLRGVRLFEGRAPLDLDLRTGEVTGIVGLLGAGKTELARGLFGAEPFTTGSTALDGEPYAPKRPSDAIRAGVHLVPEDRHADALVPGWSLAQNISLPFLKSLSKAGLVQRGKEDTLGRDTIEALGVVARDEHSTVEELSGGNQQKVVVGRWLAETPRVLILDEPFRGVDIGARRDIGRRARTLAAEGAAVLVLSADVDEVLEIADRVVVLAAGEIHLDAYGEDAERDRVIQTISASV